MDQDADLQQLMQRKDEESKEQTHSSAYNNISKSLLRLIDEAPSQNDDDAQMEFGTKDQLETLVYGENEEGHMNNKVFGYLLTWNTTLAKIEHGRIRAQLNSDS